MSQVDEIIEPDRDIHSVRFYPWDDILILTEGRADVIGDELSRRSHIVSTRSPWERFSYVRRHPIAGIFDSHLLREGDRRIMATWRYDSEAVTLEGTYLDSGEPAKVSPSDLVRFEYSGVPGPISLDVDFGSVYAVGGVLELRVAGLWVSTGWSIPEGSDWQDEDRVSIYVGNKDLMVVAAVKDRRASLDGRGTAAFYVMNKNTLEWNRVEFRGKGTRVRGLERWIVGFEASAAVGKLSPGAAERAQSSAGFGFSLEQRLEFIDVYYPGIIFGYDPFSGDSFRLETAQGDSEVLLIEGRTVFYRIHDGIYRTQIDSIGEGSPELLVQDPIIPDVHWAFVASPWPSSSPQN